MAAKTIVIFSTKGGVGKTFVSTNLAVSLGHFSGMKTILLDLDLQAFGDAHKLFNSPLKKTMLDLADSLKKDPKGTLLKDYILHIGHFNIDLLAAISQPRQAALVNGEKIDIVIERLEKEYDYIIVDAGRAFTENQFHIFDHANLIILVVTPDALSVYQTKWSLDVLQSLHIPLSMIKIILNRAQSLGGVSWQEVRLALPCDIISRIPSEGRTVGAAMNRCVPIVIDNPSSKVSQAIRDLEKDLMVTKGLFLEHQKITEGVAGQEKAFSEEGDFWKKFSLGQDADTQEDGAKEKDEVVSLKKRIHQKLIDKLNLKHLEIDMTNRAKAKAIRETTEKVVTNTLAEETGTFLSSLEVRARLVKEIVDEALGLGPLEDLISEADISDIMVNNQNQIYVERRGRLELSSKRFFSNDQVRQVIERIIAPLGRRIDESVPMVDARLPDGSRVNAIIPPLSLTGPTLTIRKFGRERLVMDDLLRLGALTKDMADFINACVVSRKNMIVSGGTGSGKTTVLNVLSAYIPEGERIITIEDAAELKLKQVHWVRLESRPPNIEGKGGITIRDLFRNTLRMRPDRIVIGECRGMESLDMLQAMNTGHDGSMTTVHANSTHDVLSRLDSMILMSGAELPVRAIREMIASALDLIIHTARLADGSRKVMAITEMTGMIDDIHVGTQDIFYFKQTGVDSEGKVIGYFTPTGYIPSFLGELKSRGIEISEKIFTPVQGQP